MYVCACVWVWVVDQSLLTDDVQVPHTIAHESLHQPLHLGVERNGDGVSECVCMCEREEKETENGREIVC